ESQHDMFIKFIVQLSSLPGNIHKSSPVTGIAREFQMSRITRRPVRRTFHARLLLRGLEERVVPNGYVVTNTADGGPGSLRQAVLDSNQNSGPDTISFGAAVSGTIGLTQGELGISDNLTIQGPGADKLAISGSNSFRVVHVNGSVELDIS